MFMKVFLKTYGCKVNQYETQAMREAFQEKGFVIVDTPDAADYIVVNTCTVTGESDRKLEYFLRRTKRKNPAVAIFLVGCYVDHYAEYMRERDLVAGFLKNDAKASIAEYVYAFSQGNEDAPVMGAQGDSFSDAGITQFDGHSRAFIKVQDGCDHFCAYCIVRVVRGKSRSRAAESVIDEVKRLAFEGYQEVILTGVQLGAYGRDFKERMCLADLIALISAIDGIERIRISSIEPVDVDDALISCLTANKKVCNHLHISLQSGDDAVLTRMRRGYSASFFRDLIGKLQKCVLGFAYSTDIIVGFPGETDEEFLNTVNFLSDIPPMKVHVFPYSDREGTDASEYGDKVPEQVKKKRVKKIIACEKAWFRENAAPLIGRDLDVLFEEVTALESGEYSFDGKTSNYFTVNGYGDIPVNKGIVTVHIESADNGVLRGGYVR